MKIKGRYEIEFSGRDWWYIIILIIVIIGILIGSTPVNSFLEDVLNKVR